MYVVLSLLAHMGLLFILLHSNTPDPEPTERVELEVIEEAKEIKQPATGGAGRHTKGKHTSHIKLNRLVPRLKMDGYKVDWRVAMMNDYNKFDGTDFSAMFNSKSQWGAGSANVNAIEYFIPLDRLRIQTDGATNYPGVLAYHNVTGTCTARLVINTSGCDWKKTQITAADRHLRVYVLSVLKKVCTFEDVKRVDSKKPINVDFAFSFLQSESRRQNTSELRGNVIEIQRWSQRSIAEWHAGPLRGIFPLPVASVDFTWLQENWDQYVNDKKPMDDFEKDYKEDLYN
jgi:hypothetical protein